MEKIIYIESQNEIVIQALDYNMQSIIINGPQIPTHTMNNIVTLKPEVDQDEHDKKIA